MKKMISLYLLILFVFSLSAQKQYADSLVNILNMKKLSSSEQLDLYYKIYDTYVLFDLEAASEYAKKGLQFAEKENDLLMASKFNASFGRIYNTKSSYDTALVYWKKAMEQAVEAKDKQQEASVYLGMGNLYGRSEDHVRALEYFVKALSIYESTGQKKKAVTVMGNIASTHRVKDNIERAVYYLEKAKDIAEEINDADSKMQIYHELGIVSYEQGKYDQALGYELKAHEISRDFEDVIYRGGTAEVLSVLYAEHVKDYDKALKYAEESLQIAEEIGDPRMILGAWNSISNIYRVQGRYGESEAAALKAWELDSSAVNIGINLMENIVLANIYSGNKEKAAMFFHKYIDIINKHTDQSHREILAGVEIKYETEKKEMRIETLEKEKKLYIWLGIAGVIILISAFGMLFFRHRLNVQKRKSADRQIEQLAREKQFIAAQAVLDGETAERSRLARDLHDGLGGMLSVIKLNLKDIKSYTVMDNVDITRFNKALEIVDESVDELRRIAHHMVPESLMRYGLKVSLDDFFRAIPQARFHYFGTDRRINERLEVLIYRCAYELVNNALKHAGADEIDIQLIVDSGLVSLSVRDNGVGFDPEKVGSGTGLENIRTRVSAYNGKIHLYSSPGNGTEVTVEIEREKNAM